MADVTLIRGARRIIAWDAGAGRHVYLADGDVAFAGAELLQVGGNYAGAATTVIEGSSLMVMPGLVDAHCHPFAEPMNKGMWDEVGSPQLYNTSLYEHLTV